jgi:hypothetical protein
MEASITAWGDPKNEINLRIRTGPIPGTEYKESNASIEKSVIDPE